MLITGRRLSCAGLCVLHWKWQERGVGGIGMGMGGRLQKVRKLQRDLCLLSVQGVGAWWAGSVKHSRSRDCTRIAGRDGWGGRLIRTRMGAGDGNNSPAELCL